MISANGLEKSFGTNKVLSDISFEIPEGSTVAVTGPSGVGKTTLLNILLDLQKPDSGSLQVPVISAAVFQEDRLIENQSAYKNIRLVCDSSVTDEKIYDALNQLLPGADYNAPVSNYSGGMRRRVAIIRACLADSEVITMDEPWTGLDDENARITAEFIKNNTNHKTLIIATHRTDLMDFDRIIEIKKQLK